MNKLFGVIAACLVLAACNDNCRLRSVKYYRSHMSSFSVRQDRNGFNIQLSYLPLFTLPGSKNPSNSKQANTDYYHFKLVVACPPGTPVTESAKTALYYALDSLFTAGSKAEGIAPSSIEPVMLGSVTHFEYLISFSKEAFKNDQPVEIFFHDRLFTNTRMSFVFDRSKIEEIELLHC